MSGFQLNVNFLGLCVFSPDPNGKEMWVLLLNARTPLKKHVGVSPHAAAVRFKLENVEKGAPGVGLWMLDRHDIRISPTDGTGLTVSCFDLARNECSAPGNKKADCFSWIAPTEEACAARGFPGGGKVDGKFLGPLPVESQVANKLGARLLLSDGTLGTATFASFGNKLVESRFRPVDGLEDINGGKDHIQFTAAVVRYSVKIPSGAVTFSATRFNGTPARELILTPVSPGKDVDIDIMNEEAERLVGIRSNAASSLVPKQHRDQDRIFERVFDLCSAPPPPKERPIPIAESFVEQPDLPILDGAPPCDPIRTG